MLKTSTAIPQHEILEGYEEILQDVRSLLEKATQRARKIVDNLRVQTYWQIGERIGRGELEHKERANYGKRVVENLALDLGFNKRDIYRMLQFYKTYPIVTSLLSQLSWSHYTVLVTIGNKEERRFYELQTVQDNWSVRQLKKELSSDLYHKTLIEDRDSLIPSIALKPVTPETVFRNMYDFDFLNLPEGYSEKELEDALMKHVERLLLEFGNDFSLAGRQRRLVIDQQVHAVDLEFYHRGIPCIVLVDLKIGRFQSDYVGQMNKYLNYYRENKMYPWEKPPVGLIVCEYQGEEEVHYALGGLQNKIFVANYETKLPSELEIREGLQKIKSEN